MAEYERQKYNVMGTFSEYRWWRCSFRIATLVSRSIVKQRALYSLLCKEVSVLCLLLQCLLVFRERVAERERKLEAEYSSKIIALSEEVLGAKKDFEARMKSFQALQV